MIRLSINFYNENAKDFFENTINADMKEAYDKFNKYLKKGDIFIAIVFEIGLDYNYFLPSI